MLELRHKDGRISAFGYAWLDAVEFDPSTGLTLRFSGRTVKITGRNLNTDVRPLIRLVEGMIRHRVSWIREADGSAGLIVGKDAVLIEEIEIE